jgi:hypothetical protein
VSAQLAVFNAIAAHTLINLPMRRKKFSTKEEATAYVERLKHKRFAIKVCFLEVA